MNSATVDASSFVAGFLMLAAGPKSEKLALAFRLFDEDADGYLKRRELWVFLRSFLTVLVAVSSRYDRLTAAEVTRFLDAGSIEATAAVFTTAEMAYEDRISFEEFGQWYNSGGFRRMAWLELLDFAKWPSVTDGDVDSSSAGGESSGADATSEEDADMGVEDDDDDEGDDDDDDDDAVFLFQLDDEGAVMLAVSQDDVNRLHRTVQSAHMDEITPRRVFEAFAVAQSDGSVAKDDFDQVVRALIPGSMLSESDKDFLSHVLTHLFKAFDRNADGECPCRVTVHPPNLIPPPPPTFYRPSGLCRVCLGL